MPFSLLLFAFLVSNAAGYEVRISNAEEFIEFKDNVISGTTFEGTTVFLDSDMDLAGKSFEPIGISYSYCFLGVFDGQGHVISDLAMNSSLEYVGVFGYSEGLTIRNVILDSSCSIASSLSSSRSDYERVGGITGLCYADNGPCIIENSVNMASVSFTGNVDSNLYLGRIAGEIYSLIYESTVRNCANYGDAIHSGTSRDSYIGGIVGYSDGSSSCQVYIYNCLNHGTITHSGTTSSDLYIGGVAGYTRYTSIENCVSTGKIESNEVESYVGSIAGQVSEGISIKRYYFTSELNNFKKYGYRYSTPSESYVHSYNSTTFELNETVSIGSYTGTSLIDTLNAYSGYYSLREYSHWLLNKNNNVVTFTINGRTVPISMNYQIMVLPSLAIEVAMSFDGWYEDNELATPLTSYEVTSDKALYGKWGEGINYAITFDTRREGVTAEPITAQFNSAVTLPSDSIKEHCSVGFWENEYGENVGLSLTMPAHNITLYAVWKCTHIKTLEDLIDLSRVVKIGVDSFNGTTVLLDSDLDFTGKTFESVGINYLSCFLGVFDGQGHVISNLELNSSLSSVGLFGYSSGLTIRNVILDSSCSISSFRDSYDARIGGLIGYCYASSEPCTIENNVNMASVSFSGSISSYSDLYIGGVVGELCSSSNYDANVKNCANYGYVTYSGVSRFSYIGGIVGYFYGHSSFKRVNIYNSLSYGTITHNGTTSSALYLGGIAGYTKCTTIENCVSSGNISSKNVSYVGSFVGYAESYTTIKKCYVTSELNSYNNYGYMGPSNESNAFSYNSTTFELNETVSVGSYTGTSFINVLNAAADYYTDREYSHWLLNKNNNAVTLAINGRTVPISMSYKIMLLPSLASEGNMCFDGWYEDSALTIQFTSYEVSSDTKLYGKWEVNTNSYTITFSTRKEGVSLEPITAQFGSVVTLPSASSADGCCNVAFWENKYGDYVGMSLTVPVHNITLYAVWKCTHIKTPEDLIEFSKVVNSGADFFNETTVFLGSDLDFGGKTFEPIGNSDYNYFRGIFDGQGYVIRNLALVSSSEYVGLFGCSTGLEIRNIIIDSSCSITGLYSSNYYSASSSVSIGGFIGECSGSDGSCIIENSVNMGSVSFARDIRRYGYLCLGGIVGYLYSFNYNSTVKNCANYGGIAFSGESMSSYIGGIVGESFGYLFIQNCLSYGTITQSGITGGLYLGGITGYTKFTSIENCVCAGKILSNELPRSKHAGIIVGYVNFNTSVNCCYITSELYRYNAYGYGTPSNESYTLSYNSTTFELNETVSFGSYTGTSLIDALNAYSGCYSLHEYSNWLLNKNNNTVRFTINGRTAPISMSYQIMLLPSLASEGIMSFDGWYEDSAFKTPLTSYDVKSDTKMYGRYCGPSSYTITFDSNGGDELAENKIVYCGITYEELPSATRTGYTFAGWFTEKLGGDKVEQGDKVTTNSDHTLYAHWKIAIQYTITFDFGNGTVNSVVLDFDAIIEYPEEMEREGFTFVGWDPRPERMPAEDITVKAQWYTIKATECVEIVFSKSLNEEEVKDTIRRFVTEGIEFSIAKLESDSEGIKVVVKFTDKESARNFVETISASSDAKNGDIKAVGFIPGGCSFASSLGLGTLIYFVAYIFLF